MKRIIAFLFVILLALAGIAYFKVMAPIVNGNASSEPLFIPKETSLAELKSMLVEHGVELQDFIFDPLAERMAFKPKAGKYLLPDKANHIDLIRHLRSGNQEPVNIIINGGRYLSDVAGQVSSTLAVDSITLLEYLSNPATQSQYGLGENDFLTLFLPNTYEVYWTLTPEEFVARMAREHEAFWKDAKRVERTTKLQMSPAEIYTMASIVEKESNEFQDRRLIAGVYLNRIDIGMPLQADPTVVYATGLFDLRRVLLTHLEFDSPYNTYKNRGLPPGPICVPSMEAIEATIHAVDHDYLYFCAKPDAPGQHVFAKSLKEHNRNARALHQWLNARGVR